MEYYPLFAKLCILYKKCPYVTLAAILMISIKYDPFSIKDYSFFLPVSSENFSNAKIRSRKFYDARG